MTLDQLIAAEAEAKGQLQQVQRELEGLADKKRAAEVLYETRKKSVEDYIENKRTIEGQRRGLR